MTDTPSPGAPPAAPITVKATAAPVITSETTKILVMAGGGLVVDRLLQSDVSRMAVLPVFGLVAYAVWGLMQRLHTWRCMRFLTEQVPDDVATIGKRRWWEFWR